MITSFGNDDRGRDRGNNKTNKTPKGIVLYLADCGYNCSNGSYSSVTLFESTANEQGTTDDD